ncbi:ATP-binding protein [Draconibacterium halophilum]|uniref:histidine kinase n=1 Tax=Draconibacterium halophilum TaxID=2706887 RepID=A0A6C0RG81_9BACT|nr:ATP-binding protein [Draconibacterium halophilum]QIA09420.1 response regulator [Draconibacterium halophilum]
MDSNSERLENIIDAIMKVARGDYSVQVAVSNDYDQVDALAMGINMMIDDLKLKEQTDRENEQIKKLNKELKAAKIKAEESERLKMAFLANMSHEIRTPMNGIIGFADVLKNNSLSRESQREYLDLIEKSGNRMLDLISDIVEISRIESQIVSKNIARVTINDKLNNLFRFFNHEAVNKGIQLKMHKGLSDDEAIVDTDYRKLDAILTNLIKNALKYTQRGAIEFGYKLKNVENHAVLEFFVSDTGMGIPKEYITHIFDRFTRSRVAESHLIEGTGLGLAISKAYVEILNGNIWVESEEGKGSVFYFTLPVGGNSQIGELVKTQKQHVDCDFTSRNFKVMVVEDDPTAEYLLKVLLERLTENILFARDGKEAIELYHSNPDIDLILMDISIPIIRGDEVIKMIRKTNKEVPIIAQTAFALDGDKERFIEIGCNDYISKPIMKDELIRIVQKYVSEVALPEIS